MAAPRQVVATLTGLIVCVTATAAAAQQIGRTSADTAGTARIAGEVVDATSGGPVSQVQVILRGTPLRTYTDLKGAFLFRPVAPGRYAVEARRIGDEPAIREDILVAAGESTTVALTMRPSAFRLDALTVVPGAFSFFDAGPTRSQTMSRADIEMAPFGEDLFRALDRLPGLASGDYGAQFSIRGGRRDETLILLDGLEIYEPFHLKDFDEGALSIIDVEAIDVVELLTGGFPARYGDKRSGVMNISSRAPREDGTHLTFGASFSNAHALGEGTFANRKGSWLLSGRRGFVDLLLRLINKKETQAPS